MEGVEKATHTGALQEVPMSQQTVTNGSGDSGSSASHAQVPRWKLFTGAPVTKSQPVQAIGKNEVSRFNPEQARNLVTTLLLLAHYGFALFSTTRGIQLSWHVAENPLDLVGMVAGILMADIVLVASMEGIRHGVFIGVQKILGWIGYIVASLGVGLATYAHGAPESFQYWYSHSFLIGEALVMSFFAFILLTTWFDVMVDNKRRSAQQRIAWQQDKAAVLTEELKLKRFIVELNEAKKRNRAYKKHLRSSGVGDKVNRDLLQVAQQTGPRIMGLLGMADVVSSGDSGAGKPEAVVAESGTSKKAQRRWFGKRK